MKVGHRLTVGWRCGRLAARHVSGASDDRRLTTLEMHSFRLRYVALGLLIYIQSAFSRTCGTDFHDAASSAVLADTVLLATATRLVHAARTPHGAVRFRVERVYKGNIPAADVGDGGGRRKPTLVVAWFSATPDRQQCVAPLVERGLRYIVFLDTANVSSGEVRTSSVRQDRRHQRLGVRQRRRLRISAFPVRATEENIRTVELYTNCTNRCRK